MANLEYIQTGFNTLSRKVVPLKRLFGTPPFDYAKSPELLQLFLQMADVDDDDIIFDFFSGSATTAHAVMKLNAEDGGKRKFIMVQLPEITDEKSEARKAGYENICEIGKERIRRAGKKIREELCREIPMGCGDRDDSLFAGETSRSDVPTRGASLACSDRDASLLAGETSRSDVPTRVAALDIGFRVLKLDSSNMEDVFYTPDEFKPGLIDGLIDNVKPDRTPLDLLFQVMPELNIELSAKIEEKEVNGKKVFFVDGNYMIATFDMDVNESTVTEIAKMKPIYFVMRDASAANDNVLDNFEQIFQLYSPDTALKIL